MDKLNLDWMRQKRKTTIEFELYFRFLKQWFLVASRFPLSPVRLNFNLEMFDGFSSSNVIFVRSYKLQRFA
jgi:hypothetical protein